MAAKDSKLEQRAAAIAACRDKSGRIAPNIVVDAARDPASPLHDEFEWDVAKAAERDWIRTACELIRSVKFIVEFEDRKIIAPYYVSDPSRDESAYIQTARVAKNGAMSERVLRDELARIVGAIHRAMTLASAFNLKSSFERMLDEAVKIEHSLGGDDDGEEATA
jgi:hypothetical protein